MIRRQEHWQQLLVGHRVAEATVQVGHISSGRVLRERGYGCLLRFPHQLLYEVKGCPAAAVRQVDDSRAV